MYGRKIIPCSLIMLTSINSILFLRKKQNNKKEKISPIIDIIFWTIASDYSIYEKDESFLVSAIKNNSGTLNNRKGAKQTSWFNSAVSYSLSVAISNLLRQKEWEK